MEPTEFFAIVTAIVCIFVGLPWLVFHHITKWKQAKTLTLEDENLLDELHDLARKLDERMTTIERIHAADRALEASQDATRVAAIRPRSLGKDL